MLKFEGRKGKKYDILVNPYPIFPDHLVGGEWTQGEAFSLHLAEEKLCSLPEAQQHRFMARPVREPDDDRTYINGDIWIVITPAE